MSKEQKSVDEQIVYYETTSSLVPQYLIEERDVNLGQRDKLPKIKNKNEGQETSKNS